MHSATQNQQTTEMLQQKCTLEEKNHPLTAAKTISYSKGYTFSLPPQV